MVTSFSLPSFDISDSGDGQWLVRVSGPLNIHSADETRSRLIASLKNSAVKSVVFDLEQVSAVDEYGALVLSELKDRLALSENHFQLLNAPEILVQHFRRMASESTVSLRRPRSFAGYEFITQTGATTIETLRGIRDFVTFIGALVLSGIRVAGKPKSLRTHDIVRYMKTTGVDALPVVGLISFLIGLIMAFMSSLQLKQFGANIYVASLVALSMVSELGPIMTAIIVSGRSGSAYAAEISTMKISEEIDALITMGFDPVLFLAIPRMIAAVIVIPLLTMFANLFAIAGGLLIGVTMLDLSASSYITQTINSLNLFELNWGLSKSFVFAILISGVGCLRGFQAKGGASAVGHAATSAVVTSIFLIVLFDSIFAVVRSYWG